MRDQTCPACGSPNDSVMGVDTPGRPDPDSLLICFSCSCIAVVTQDLCLRLPTDSELQGILTDPTVLDALTAIWRAKAMG